MSSAERSGKEIVNRGGKTSYEEILAKVIERDRIDSTRAVAPLKPAKDAVILDSDKLSADQVFEKVYDLCMK